MHLESQKTAQNGLDADEVITDFVESGRSGLDSEVVPQIYASARSHSCFSDPEFPYRPRPKENWPFRIR